MATRKKETVKARKSEGFVEFLPRFVDPAGTRGIPAQRDTEFVEVPIESICGGIDNSQPVEQYDGTLGVTADFVNQHQGAVGNIQWNSNLAAIYTNPGNVSGVRFCSGTLIGADLFLTAGHCFDQTGGGWARPRINGTDLIIPPEEIATNMHIDFNYQSDPTGKPREIQSFAIVELLEYRLNGLDFAIVRVAGNPGQTFGITGVSQQDASIGDMLCIIGHPEGMPKRIEAGPLSGISDNFLLYNDIDTLGGSSGSGILGPAGTVVGVHTNGGCDDVAVGNNFGVRISPILAASPILGGLLFPLCS